MSDINIFELLKKEFKIGESVVIIHNDTTSGEGKLKYGKLGRMERNYCSVGGKDYYWEDVIFMSHDGFPCRTLKLNMTTEELDNIENEEIILLMRKLLIQPKPKVKTVTKTIYKRILPPTRRYSCSGGCPFTFEDVGMKIINPFNKRDDFEETLVMTSRDGARGFMWDIKNEIFDFSVN